VAKQPFRAPQLYPEGFYDAVEEDSNLTSGIFSTFAK